MFENPRRGRQARNFNTNVPKIVDLQLSTEQIFPENWRWVPLIKNLKCLFVSFVFPFLRKNIKGHFNYYSPNGPLKCTHWVEELYLTDSTSRTSYRNKKRGWDKWSTLYILILKGMQQPELCPYSHLECYLIYRWLSSFTMQPSLHI